MNHKNVFKIHNTAHCASLPIPATHVSVCLFVFLSPSVSVSDYLIFAYNLCVPPQNSFLQEGKYQETFKERGKTLLHGDKSILHGAWSSLESSQVIQEWSWSPKAQPRKDSHKEEPTPAKMGTSTLTEN